MLRFGLLGWRTVTGLCAGFFVGLFTVIFFIWVNDIRVSGIFVNAGSFVGAGLGAVIGRRSWDVGGKGPRDPERAPWRPSSAHALARVTTLGPASLANPSNRGICGQPDCYRPSVATVTISSEIRILAAPTVVWSVLATPSQQPVVEPRTRLVSEWGERGTVGSGYELAARGRPTTRLRVTESVPGEVHIVAVEWDGRTRGSQGAHLRPDGGYCILNYTMSIEVPLGLRSIQRVYGTKQLRRWLEAVDRVSTLSAG